MCDAGNPDKSLFYMNSHVVMEAVFPPTIPASKICLQLWLFWQCKQLQMFNLHLLSRSYPPSHSRTLILFTWHHPVFCLPRILVLIHRLDFFNLYKQWGQLACLNEEFLSSLSGDSKVSMKMFIEQNVFYENHFLYQSVSHCIPKKCPKM